MYCPRCGARQSLGASRCDECGAPFTKREATRRRAGPQADAAVHRPQARPAAAAYPSRSYERGPGVGRKMIAWLMVAVVAVVAIVVLATVLTSNIIQPYFGEVATQESVDDHSAEIVQDQTTNPVAVTGAQQVVITQEELNSRISEHSDQIGLLDQVRVEIEPDQLTLHANAYGVSGRYHGTVQARDGQLVLVDGRSSGMLGWLIPVDQLESTLNREMNAALSEAGVTVESVALEPGRMILGVNA